VCNAWIVCFIWTLCIKLNLQIHPQTMLFGHTGAITCLAMANNTADNTFIVSSADNGYIHINTLLFVDNIMKQSFSEPHGPIR